MLDSGFDHSLNDNDKDNDNDNDDDYNNDATSKKGSIHVYHPQTNSLNLLLCGLERPLGLTCTPSSDLIFIEDCVVHKKGDETGKTYTTKCIKCIAGCDVMDYSLSGEIIPRHLQKVLTVIPPSLVQNARVPLLLEDGTLLLACRRGSNDAVVEANYFGKRHGSGTIGGLIVAFEPQAQQSNKVERDEEEEEEEEEESFFQACGGELISTPGCTSAYFENVNLGKEPRVYDKLDYSNVRPQIFVSDTCIINDITLSPISGEIVVAGGGCGPSDCKPPSINIHREGQMVPLGIGCAECVTVGGYGFETLREVPLGGRQRATFEQGGFDKHCPNGFTAYFVVKDMKGKRLCGMYSKNSVPARILRTRAAANIAIPETPRSLTPSISDSDSDRDDTTVESSVEPDHEELFANLSNALAAEEGEADFVRRAAFLDPSLSTTGPVNVKVVLRCRPLLKNEIKAFVPSAVRCSRNDVTVDGSFLPLKSDKVFTFDRVFGPETSQRVLYLEVVAPIVHRVLDGFKCTVFAYGQTGSGKTYSMEGDASNNGAEASGLIPRAVHTIFDELNSDKTCRYSVSASHLEVYLEQPYDLLASESAGGWKAGSHMKERLKIVELPGSTQKDAGVNIVGLSEVQVKKPSDVFKIMHRTKQNRHVAETLCNRASSRSHAIFSINVVLTKRDPEGRGVLTKRGSLHLVDLSGSESIKRSGVEGLQAAEASVIGKSLLSLGRVIRGLVAKDKHVPFRESKLTRILSDSLGGSSYTALLLAITPNSEMIAETMSTLGYGMLARNISNLPKRNEKIEKRKKKKKKKKNKKNNKGDDGEGGGNGKEDSTGESESEEEDKEEAQKNGNRRDDDSAEEEAQRAARNLTSVFDANGEMINLDGTVDVREAVVPWLGHVPIRKRGTDRTPVGNMNNTPRVFHGETVEWARLILKDGKLSHSAEQCFKEIFLR